MTGSSSPFPSEAVRWHDAGHQFDSGTTSVAIIDDQVHLADPY